MIEQAIAKYIADHRQWYQIKVMDVLRLFMKGMPYGGMSLHALDNLGRIPHIKKSIGSSRPMVVSDTSLSRLFEDQLTIPVNLPQLVLETIKPFLPSPKGKRLLLIDGSGQSGRLYSIAALHWTSPIVVGIEQQEKQGKELPVSRQLIQDTIHTMGSWFDVVVGDGLYFDQESFSTVFGLGKHLFVKTREQNLEIVQYTEAAYKISRASEWQKHKEKERFDSERGILYKVFQLRNYAYRNMALHCFRVEERDPKTDKIEVFFCVTTAPDIAPSEAREIAKLRWQIEDNVFRHGNQLFHTKRKLFRNNETNRKYLTLLYLLLGLFQLLFVRAIHTGIFTSHSMNLKGFIEWTLAEWLPNSS